MSEMLGIPDREVGVTTVEDVVDTMEEGPGYDMEDEEEMEVPEGAEGGFDQAADTFDDVEEEPAEGMQAKEEAGEPVIAGSGEVVDQAADDMIEEEEGEEEGEDEDEDGDDVEDEGDYEDGGEVAVDGEDDGLGEGDHDEMTVMEQKADPVMGTVVMDEIEEDHLEDTGIPMETREVDSGGPAVLVAEPGMIGAEDEMDAAEDTMESANETTKVAAVEGLTSTEDNVADEWAGVAERTVEESEEVTGEPLDEADVAVEEAVAPAEVSGAAAAVAAGATKTEATPADEDMVVVEEPAKVGVGKIAPTVYPPGEDLEEILVKTEFVWADGAENDVKLSGAWNGWMPVQMFHEGGGLWSVVTPVPAGVHEFKFIVDGEWMLSSRHPTVGEDEDSKNNVRVIRPPTKYVAQEKPAEEATKTTPPEKKGNACCTIS